MAGSKKPKGLLEFTALGQQLRHAQELQRAQQPPKATVVNGRWKIARRLGEGGQGQTFLVKDVTGQRNGFFVLKQLKSKKPKALQRFAREVEAVKKLKHPGII